ncbi:MAG: hypothetical protein Rubg2KO_33770 [Rubricoccaceae bacterium]
MRPAFLVLALLASACASDTTDSPDPSSTPESLSENAVAETGSVGDAECLLGTWQIDPASMDLNKVEGIQDIPNADFSVGASSGRALLAFESDGNALQTFEDFSITIDAAVSGIQMSVRNDYSGTASGTYAVEDGRISMEPGDADLSIAVSVNGGAPVDNPMGVESLFEEGERGRTAFTCSDDELMFTIHSPDSDGGEAFIRDIRYTRAAG